MLVVTRPVELWLLGAGGAGAAHDRSLTLPLAPRGDAGAAAAVGTVLRDVNWSPSGSTVHWKETKIYWAADVESKIQQEC